jgi:hypothetical protein
MVALIEFCRAEPKVSLSISLTTLNDKKLNKHSSASSSDLNDLINYLISVSDRN